MNNTKVFLFLLLSFISLVNFGQFKFVSGIVKDTNDVKLPFVSITISLGDSVISGTITDFEGYFECSNIKNGEMDLMVSSIGYKKDSIRLDFSTKDSLTCSFYLEDEIKKINEVVVEGSLIENKYDKTIFIVSKDEKAKSNTAFDLIANLPKLYADLVNNKFQSIGGKPVIILINGIISTDKDLLTIKPDEIHSIEYYDIIPTRFSLYNPGLVLNLITKSHIQGGDIFANVSSALTTGFSDDYISYRYTKKNNQFSVNYSYSYRNYDERVSSDVYKYHLSDSYFEKMLDGKNSFLKYGNHDLRLRYINISNKGTLKIDVNNEFFKSTRDNLQEISQSYSNLTINSNYIDSVIEFFPNLDFYYNRKLKNNQEISANLVTTFYKTNYSNSIIQNSNIDTIFTYFSDIENSKKSVISELLYEKSFKNFKFSSGLITSFQNSIQKSNSISNVVPITSTSANFYGYSEIAGKLNKFTYNFGFGVRYNNFRSEELNTSNNFYAIRPRINIGYQLSDHSTLRLNTSLGQNSPSLGILSSNIIYIDSVLLTTGNPNLNPYNAFYNSIEYSLTKSRLQFYLALCINYFDSPYLPIIKKQDQTFISTYENYDWERQFFPQFSLTYKLFKKKALSLNFYYTLLYFENNYSVSNSLFSNSFSGGLRYNWKDFMLDYTISDNGRYLRGELISKGETSSNIQLRYSRNDLSVTLGILQPFNNSIVYESKLAKNSVLDRVTRANIYDNGQMVYLKLSYYFSFGKSPENISSKLHNEDTDSGVFKGQ